MNDARPAELVAVNAAFYRALEALDLPAMEALWRHDDTVRCVHPGWPLLVGWEAVHQSWESIFASTEEMRFTITDVRPLIQGDVAWVSCTENILSEIGGRLTATAVLATNLFVRGPEGWRMVHHHASHVLGPPPPER